MNIAFLLRIPMRNSEFAFAALSERELTSCLSVRGLRTELGAAGDVRAIFLTGSSSHLGRALPTFTTWHSVMARCAEKHTAAHKRLLQ